MWCFRGIFLLFIFCDKSLPVQSVTWLSSQPQHRSSRLTQLNCRTLSWTTLQYGLGTGMRALCCARCKIFIVLIRSWRLVHLFCFFLQAYLGNPEVWRKFPIFLKKVFWGLLQSSNWGFTCYENSKEISTLKASFSHQHAV